jgi:hypothetical protein
MALTWRLPSRLHETRRLLRRREPELACIPRCYAHVRPSSGAKPVRIKIPHFHGREVVSYLPGLLSGTPGIPSCRLP